MTAMLDAFLEAAWNEHGERPQDVADRLEASRHLVRAPAQIAPYARLVTHVIGEHLGQWQDGIDLLESLRRLEAFDGSAGVEGALVRSVAIMRFARGDDTALVGLGLEDRVVALASASSMFAGRGQFNQAIESLKQALALAADTLPPGSAGIRALAVGGNNLAAALESSRQRDPVQTAAMLVAAQAGLKYWTPAGTWLEEERAHYQLARCLLGAGQAAAASHSANQCIQLCELNRAPDIELFFGHAVLALALREAGDVGAFEASRRLALACHDRVAQGEKRWCERELNELEPQGEI